MPRPFYITTTLPYVNNKPHVGFAMEIIRADAVARFKRLLGHEVFFNTGTDEHGAKLYEAAQKAEKDTKAYVDEYALHFKRLMEGLNISANNFIRTTDPHHILAAQEFWNRAQAAGDIYKKLYKVKYCNGCELEKTDSELENGKCPLHPDRELEIREEENYFFRYSKYGPQLLKLYEERPDFVIPEWRLNEVREFAKRGLEDFSISRLKEKLSWGIPVPGDEAQVMYVWFDALVNYISAIGWPNDEATFEKWWNESGGVVQYCGKDNNRQQSSMWQAMLLSVGIRPSRQIIVDGFITSQGKKMSKSLGNVIDPFEVIASFTGALFPEEVLRFVVLHDVSSFEDSDLTLEAIKESYTANFVNGLGNLTSRIMRLATTHLTAPVTIGTQEFSKEYVACFDRYDLRAAIQYVTGKARYLDAHIQATEPFKVVKTDPEKGKEMITQLVQDLYHVAFLLVPFLPKTGAHIMELIQKHAMPERPLFTNTPLL